jgi:hypothetical protein
VVLLVPQRDGSRYGERGLDAGVAHSEYDRQRGRGGNHLAACDDAGNRYAGNATETISHPRGRVMAKDYKNEDGVAIMPLGEMRDFEVAEGYPDIRGWKVRSADGAEVGKVHELLVDADSMRTRYVDVRLTSEIAATPGDRDVLVPIGAAHLDEKANLVIVPLHAERIGLLPPYTHDRLTRAHEYEVRRHFSLGEATAAAATGAAGAAASRNFYDHPAYDDKRFFIRRSGTEPVAEPAADSSRAVGPGDKEVRIAVAPDDSVVLKRGKDGNDEIIVRRPAHEHHDDTREP